MLTRRDFLRATPAAAIIDLAAIGSVPVCPDQTAMPRGSFGTVYEVVRMEPGTPLLRLYRLSGEEWPLLSTWFKHRQVLDVKMSR